MKIDDQILASIETLEAIYFLFKSLEPNKDRLNMGRALFSRLTENEKLEFLRELVVEIEEAGDKSEACG